MSATVPLEQAMELRREIEQLMEKVALRQIAHARADGALADAATVPTGDLERGIRALTAERDRLKAEGERLSLGLVRMQKIAATVDADLRARTAERDGLKAEVERLKGRASGASDPAVVARALIRQHTDDAEEFAPLEHAILDAISAEHTRWVMANAGWKEMDRQRLAAEADVQALAEALEMILPYAKHSFACPDATSAFTGHLIETIIAADNALARDGVRRGMEETG